MFPVTLFAVFENMARTARNPPIGARIIRSRLRRSRSAKTDHHSSVLWSKVIWKFWLRRSFASPIRGTSIKSRISPYIIHSIGFASPKRRVMRTVAPTKAKAMAEAATATKIDSSGRLGKKIEGRITKEMTRTATMICCHRGRLLILNRSSSQSHPNLSISQPRNHALMHANAGA